MKISNKVVRHEKNALYSLSTHFSSFWFSLKRPQFFHFGRSSILVQFRGSKLTLTFLIEKFDGLGARLCSYRGSYVARLKKLPCTGRTCVKNQQIHLKIHKNSDER